MALVIFSNPGVAELAALTTLGVSVKEGENAIGMFGTGFKFAVAVLLRNGCTVRLFRGKEEHVFSLRDTVIRGKTFQMVYLDNQSLNITTELGKSWEVWMAYRELHSNALDEGGDTTMSTFVGGIDNETQIIVGGEKITEAFNKRHVIFLSSRPIVTTSSLAVHEYIAPVLYYRGVRVAILLTESIKKSAFTYNIISLLPLADDRTYRDLWTIQRRIAREMVEVVRDKTVLRKFIEATNTQGMYETQCEVQFYKPTEEFLSILNEVYDSGALLSANCMLLLRQHRQELRRPVAAELDEIQDAVRSRAEIFVEKLGFGKELALYDIIPVNAARGVLSVEDKLLTVPVASFGSAAELATHILKQMVVVRCSATDDEDVMSALAKMVVSQGQKLYKEYL